MAILLGAGGHAAQALDILRRGNGAEPGTLDPQRMDAQWEIEIANDLFLGLTTPDAHAAPVPGAAEKWSVSADGLTWTFKLRPGLMWSDGTPLTAGDFVYSFRRLLDPHSAIKYASIQYVIKNAAAVNAGKLPPERLGVTAPDPSTVQIALEAPTPYLPSLLMHVTALPVPAHVVRRYGDAWANPEHMVSNGPYVLAEHTPHNVVRLTRNPRFYDAAAVAIDEVRYYPIEDEQVALTRFRARDLDMNVTTSGFPMDQLAWLRQNMPGQAHVVPALVTTYMAFNMQRPPFSDQRLRRAVSLCIDRNILATKVMQGQSTPAYSFVPPGIANYTKLARMDFAGWPPEKRVAAAKDLMRAAAYGPDHPLAFDLLYMNSLAGRRTAIALAAMLKTCDIVPHLIADEPKVFYSTVQQGDFTAAVAAWGADYNDPQTFLYVLDSRSVGFDYGGYANPAYNALLDQGKVELDPAKRATVLARAEQIALDDVAVAPLTFPSTRALVAPYVKGYADNAVDAHPTRWMRLEK
jgi:oligopeptide transport system substrate-binding protein